MHCHVVIGSTGRGGRGKTPLHVKDDWGRPKESTQSKNSVAWILCLSRFVSRVGREGEVSETTKEPYDRATKFWVLSLTSIASLMAALDAMVVTTALGTIRLDLGASIETLQWTVNGYGPIRSQ
jgi:hypothetical protein